MTARIPWIVAVILAASAVAVLTASAYQPVIASFVGATAAAQIEPPVATLPLPGEPIRIMPSPHMPALDGPHPVYTSIPPTSGPHLPWTVAAGIYRQFIPDELQVHALEHGHVMIQYRPDAHPNAVAALESFARLYPRDVLVAPHPGLDSGIVLTAWGRIERLTDPDPVRIDRFVRSLRGRFAHGWTR